METNRSIRLTNKKLFSKNLKFLKNVGLSNGQHDYFTPEGNFYFDDSDEIIPYDYLNNKYELNNSEINWYSDLNVWWICKKGHVAVKKPSSYIKNEFAAGGKKEDRIFYSDLVCLICFACNLSATDLYFKWDDNTLKNASNNDIVFASLIYKRAEKVYWFCEKCENLFESFHGSIGNFATDKIEYMNKFIGICNFCNFSVLYTGYNDLRSAYPNLAFSWNEEKNLYPMNEILFHKESEHLLYWFSCQNKEGEKHEWRSWLWKENYNTTCYYCGLPVKEDFYNAVQGMGLERIFSEFSPNELEKCSQKESEKLNYTNLLDKLFTKSNWVCSKDSSHKWSNKTPYQRIKHPHCPVCVKWITEYDFLILFNELSDYTFHNGHIKTKWLKSEQIQIDILDPVARIAIDYDGYRTHSGDVHHSKNLKEEVIRDTNASNTVLGLSEDGKEKYIMVRIREKDTKKGSLPSLEIYDENYFEIEYPTKSDKKIIVETVLRKILEIRAKNG